MKWKDKPREERKKIIDAADAIAAAIATGMAFYHYFGDRVDAAIFWAILIAVAVIPPRDYD